MAVRRLGMYSPEIKRDTVERFFDAVAVYGFGEVQFDFLTVGGEQMPERIDDELVRRIGQAAAQRGIAITAVNGTFNMIHPDKSVREDGVHRFAEIARVCSVLRCPLITLCTGSRNTDSMWQPHRDNDGPDAWRDLLETTSQLIPIAEQYGVQLGVEAEASNVVNTAQKARKLLDEMGSDRLKIIFDPANLFHEGEARQERAVPVLEEAFELLHRDIAIAHAKDIHGGPGIEFTSAGRGIVAFERLLELLDSIGYRGGIIAHGIKEEGEFPYSVAFLNRLMGLN